MRWCRRWRRAARGHLLFVSSLSGKAPTAMTSLYNATKFGLRGFALGLRPELRERGVGVSVVNPGFIREAGMFAASGAKLPTGVGTRSPQDVGRAVAEAIERNRAEVDVAPLALRFGSAFAGLAPGLAATVTRKTGSDKLAEEMAAGHRAKGSNSFGTPYTGVAGQLRDGAQDGWRKEAPQPTKQEVAMNRANTIRAVIVVGALATGGAVAGIAGAAAAPSGTRRDGYDNDPVNAEHDDHSVHDNPQHDNHLEAPSKTARRRTRRVPRATRARIWAKGRAGDQLEIRLGQRIGFELHRPSPGAGADRC